MSQDPEPARIQPLGAPGARALRPAPATPPAAAAEAGATADGEAGAKGRKKKKKKDRKKDQLGSARGIETMFRTSYRTHIDMSSLADNKANIMISINGLIMSIIIASIFSRIDTNPWLAVPTTLLLVGCLISMVFAVLAARPRVSSRLLTLDEVRQNRANILFFGNFVNMNQTDFLDGMVALLGDTDKLYTSMMRDLYSLGGVLARKYRLLRTAYTLFMISLVVSVVLFITVFVAFTPTELPV